MVVQHIYMIFICSYIYISYAYASICNYRIVILYRFLQRSKLGIEWLSHIIVRKFLQIWGARKGREEREGREKLHVNILFGGIEGI